MHSIVSTFTNQFHSFPFAIQIGMGIVLALTLGYVGAPLWSWALVGISYAHLLGAPIEMTVGLTTLFIIFAIRPVRRLLISSGVMRVMRNVVPKISETERTALEAGVVWSEAELFSGKPNFKKLMSEPYPELTDEEKAFINGPLEELCEMLNEWKIWKSRDVPPNVLQFIKDKGLLGMIIPKEYGGLAFSANAHADIVMKLATRSVPTAITVMVPNSLGPAELLIHYGTDEQKNYWLPRLAKGLEMPCFGLTEPTAGSDAGALKASGVLFKGQDGKIYIRLNWKKRWITLAAISTVVGLAFRLRDPENLLGRGEDLGITVGLIPSKTPGVVLGRRHDPLSVPFYNCPTEGHDVVVLAEDTIIGGIKNAGIGWKMLMESLAAGRGISLPAQAVAGTMLSARVASAHASIRKQFGIAIGKFEGIEEPLARIGGAAYYLEAMRKYTLSALDQGLKPAVVTAIAKYNATEVGRQRITDAMDIMGGSGISMGPRNVLAIPYIATPIGITVEGANILTRTLMIFGQGALRAHPYAFKEVNAIENNDLIAFDAAFWGHIGHVVRNKVRALVLSLTRGYIAGRGYGSGVGRYFQKLSWASASFAILADLAMALLGGSLKFREKITGRFADILSWMYIGTAVLRRFEAEGKRKQDLPFVHYSMRVVFTHIQQAFDGIYANFDVPILGWIFKGPMRFWSSLNVLGSPPSDALGHKVSRLLMSDTEQRERLTQGVYLPKATDQALGLLEHTFKLVKRAEESERKIREAVKKKTLPKLRGEELFQAALAKGVISKDEHENLLKAEEWRMKAIQVDDFSDAEYHSNGMVEASGPLNQAYGK